MAKFNIKNSNVGQLADSGNNYQTINQPSNENVSHETGKESIVSQVAATLDRIFIVHGHDNEMKEAVARAVSTLGLEPIILHEQPNEGKTIIEKFEKHADVGFAIVLLSPDDKAYAKASGPATARFRARQNVVLELGYFAGKLGRSRVFSLHRGGADLELPSDIAGVVYSQFDANGQWKFSLAQELRAAGYNVDANKLI
jgi:predicted nucleotide-binding protein